MMTNKKTPLSEAAMPAQRDPYALRGIEQILALFNGGEFLDEVMDGHKNLQQDLLEHRAEHGSKGCNGSMTITVNYALGKSGDVAMGATVGFKAPKKPPSSAAAFLNGDGSLTLMSPLLTRMHQPVRDAGHHPSEVRDTD